MEFSYNIEVKYLAFSSFKICSTCVFSVKDPIPLDLCSRVVYKFSCAGCNACYIGETSGHISTHIREHLSRDRNSHIYQHLQQSQACRGLANNNCFSIVDCAFNNTTDAEGSNAHQMGESYFKQAAETC